MDLFRLRLIHIDMVLEPSRHRHTFRNIQERKSYKRERKTAAGEHREKDRLGWRDIYAHGGEGQSVTIYINPINTDINLHKQHTQAHRARLYGLLA